jgi:transcription antitermination factor NusG
MKTGERARIIGGPFLGMYGTVVSSSGQRTVLAVAFETREIQVELAHDWLVEATPRRPSMSFVEEPKQNRRKKG